MKTVAVISEYNPFHLGHAYHLSEIRKEFGDDVTIIAIMSGNFTQRGELAIADAHIRAEAAVQGGVQLVLELPFPFSSSSAERFADAGVAIAEHLGIVDVLSFGSECGDLSRLETVAERMNSQAYLDEISTFDAEDENRTLGHATRATQIYEKLYGNDDTDLLTKSNNLLAIEYLRALKRRGSPITPHTVCRLGNAYLDTDLTVGQYPSAQAIREIWKRADRSHSFIFSETDMFIPAPVHEIYRRAFLEKEMPVDISRLSNVALAFLRNILPTSITCPVDGAGGLYHRICKKSWDASDIEEVIRLSCTKKYTVARIRRLILYALIGITSSELSAEPIYSQILAMDANGQAALKCIKKKGDIELLTKPADYIALTKDARRQAEVDLRADELFSLAKPVVSSGGMAYRRRPYVKPSN